MSWPWWFSFLLFIGNLNVLLVHAQYSGWYGSQAYPGYGTPPIVIGSDGGDDLRSMLPILLLLLLDNFGGNRNSGGCGNCCCGCCCGNGNNGNSIPIPYPIPIPVNNPVIA